MGGGHVSRPDFGMPQPDAAYPLTEFYLLAQQALEKSGSFMLPALYAGLQAPARRIYREEAAGYLQLAAAPAEGLTRLLYALLVMADSTVQNHSLRIGLYSIAAAYIQLIGYGTGFWRAWWNRCVCGRGEFEAFKKNFYK